MHNDEFETVATFTGKNVDFIINISKEFKTKIYADDQLKKDLYDSINDFANKYELRSETPKVKVWKNENIPTFNEYQDYAMTTAIYPKGDSLGLYYAALGLAGEAGEVAGKVSKIIRDKNGVLTEEDREHLISENGDCLWFLSALATELNVDLGEVARRNLVKLEGRKQRNTIGGSGEDR